VLCAVVLQAAAPCSRLTCLQLTSGSLLFAPSEMADGEVQVCKFASMRFLFLLVGSASRIMMTSCNRPHPHAGPQCTLLFSPSYCLSKAAMMWQDDTTPHT
jgi:hypothetical protein